MTRGVRQALIVGTITTLFGVFVGHYYERATTPIARVVADGSCVTYLPEPGATAARPNRAFYSLSVRNEGTRRAQGIRLGIPLLLGATLNDSVNISNGPTENGILDLGTLEAGDQVAIAAWADTGRTLCAVPSLSHADGPGEVRLRTVPERHYALVLNFEDASAIVVPAIALSVLIVIVALFLAGALISKRRA